MNIEVKSSNGISLIPADSRLLTERIVFLTGEINEDSALEFVKKILILDTDPFKTPIKVLINSPGGEINSGLLIYDVIQSTQCPIELYCLGKAYSMAAVIFASGKDGRYMFPNSELMLHEPLLSQKINGNLSSIKSISESLIDVKNKIVKVLEKHTGKGKEEIEQALSFEHYFNPQEAEEFGLSDGIRDFNSITPKE